jgi:hypothetical protein
MLKPTKHSHPDQTVVNLTMLLIQYLQVHRVEDYTDLYQFAKKQIIGGDVLFLPTLNFLYLLGLVEYHKNTDSVEYLGSQ